jgi:hypothetical protein
VLEDQTVDISLFDDIKEFDTIVPAIEGPEDFYLPIDLSRFDFLIF